MDPACFAAASVPAFPAWDGSTDTRAGGPRAGRPGMEPGNRRKPARWAAEHSGWSSRQSAASGRMVALSIIAKFKGNDITFPEDTMLGSLAKYVSTESDNFQPMNANFGILKPLDKKIRDKKEKYGKLAEISLESIERFKAKNF